MTNKNLPTPPTQPRLNLTEPPPQWHTFITQTLNLSNNSQQNSLVFPLPQLLAFSQSSACPKLKILLEYLPAMYCKFRESCSYANYKQIIILLYVLTLKGCVATCGEVVRIGMAVVEEMIKFRAIVVCSCEEGNVVGVVYGYLEKFLGIFVPAVLMNTSQKQKNKNQQKFQNINKKSFQSKPKTFLQLLLQINKPQQQQVIDNLLIIFQCLLICKIRNHLTSASLFQFDSIMRKVYSPEKFRLVYQGKGFVSHIFNKEKEKTQNEKELVECALIQIGKLVPARLQQNNWQTIDLQLQLPTQKPPISKAPQSPSQPSPTSVISLKRTPSQTQPQPWVQQAYTQAQPSSNINKIKITYHTMLTSMKTMQIYRFLCLLQIYGSSPYIEVLNQYVPDQGLLELFTKFLVGEGLVESAIELMRERQTEKDRKKMQSYDNRQNAYTYSYKNERFAKILQTCYGELTKLPNKQQINLLLQELTLKKQSYIQTHPHLNITSLSIGVKNGKNEGKPNGNKKVQN